jgi:DNA-binding transcriptional MerR regulator
MQMRVGQVAEAAGVTIKALRYDERSRLYPTHDMRRASTVPG